ncbi:sugar nucleotidyltransferase [Streptomyces sp. NPDC101490]|uniref:sugar nucleotidyltransferase n=1 Tax=Streptomyces sp. NPDC101490 TaxID=3366143 RepID=UPI003805E56C
MRGIILAGGSATRLRPLTLVSSKQLLPVYDKPMIYYPLSLLIELGLREILVIAAPEHRDSYERLLGDGSRFGIRLEYAVQDFPRGLAHALLLARTFVGDGSMCLALGDNLFHGPKLQSRLRDALLRHRGCTLFSRKVANPEQYGVATVDALGRITSLVEKPERPRSSLAVTGLYLYDNDALDKAAGLTPSHRGELEITDLNRSYVQEGRATLVELGDDTTWFDTGTPDSLLDAAQYIRMQQQLQAAPVGSPAESALRAGLIDREPPEGPAPQSPGTPTPQPPERPAPPPHSVAAPARPAGSSGRTGPAGHRRSLLTEPQP